MFGFLFPRKSKLYIEFSKECKKGKNAAMEFMKNLSYAEMSQLANEVMALSVDKLEQQLFENSRKEIENKTYPIGFSND